jgi:hypothetical protein
VLYAQTIVFNLKKNPYKNRTFAEKIEEKIGT